MSYPSASAGASRSATSRRNFLRGTGAAGFFALTGGSLGACGDSSGSQSGGASTGGPKALNLGFSVTFLTTPFWTVMVSFVEDEIKKQAQKMMSAVSANQDAGKQLTDIRSLMLGGANGILSGVVDPKAITPALEYAKSQKVPVVTVDDAPVAGNLYAIVRADNVGMGADSAKKMGELIGGKGKVLVLAGSLATTNGQDRANGFKDYAAKNFPGMEVIVRDAGWQGPKGGDIAATILTQHPDLSGISIQSDTIYGPSVFTALQSAGKLVPVGDPKHIALVGIDGGKQALDAIRANTLDAAVCQPCDLFAKWGVQYLIDAVNGKQLQAGKTDHSSNVVDFNGNLEDQLPAPVVTKANVDDKTLWGNSALAK